MPQEPKKSSDAIRSSEAFAEMVWNVARAAKVDVILYVTEDGSLYEFLRNFGKGPRLVAASSNQKTCQNLIKAGTEAVQVPPRVQNNRRQAQVAISVAQKEGKIVEGQLVACAVGNPTSAHAKGDLIMILDLVSKAVEVSLKNLVKSGSGIRPLVLEAALEVACKIGKAAQRGKRVGAILTIGQSDRILESSRQLILNPFHGHPEKHRMLTNPDVHDMVVELAKLDGAFVVRGDGLLLTGATFLAPGPSSISVPAGLGARHVAAASATANTSAVAVVVSATDGLVRVFTGGKMVLCMDPDTPYRPSKK